MKIGGSDRSANFEIKYKEFKNLNDTLNELYMISEQLPTAPKITSNFNNYKITLKQINSQIEQIKFERRIKTLKEIGMSVLQILGYISIGAIILYILYKCKFCQIISKCIPGTLCINILSPTANPVLHQRQGPQLTTSNSASNNSEPTCTITTPEFEDLIDIRPAKKCVRFVSRRNKILTWGNVTD